MILIVILYARINEKAVALATRQRVPAVFSCHFRSGSVS